MVKIPEMKNNKISFLIHIAKWNGQTVYQPGKLKNVQIKMTRLQVFGIGEDRLTGSESVK